jgi:RNA polymerase subunit RPABC4/transcription elongation factor Spt4
MNKDQFAYLNENIVSLESERDRWYKQAHESEQRYLNASAECDRLKAELEKLSCPHCGSDVDGKNWKALAEKMREASRIGMEWVLLGNHDEAPGWIEARDSFERALALFDAKGDMK